MATGLRESSSNLFICECGNNAFAVGIDPSTLEIFGLLCLFCGTDYFTNALEEGGGILRPPLEPTRVLH